MKGAGVLIVHDDDGVRDLFTRALAPQGFVVRCVASGEKALQLITHERPQMIVLDLMMPGINGIEVLATIREEPQTAAVPVLATTATATSARSGNSHSFTPQIGHKHPMCHPRWTHRRRQ
jgi:CheY-like chemotaxis protein